jgi:hypothetical protein
MTGLDRHMTVYAVRSHDVWHGVRIPDGGAYDYHGTLFGPGCLQPACTKEWGLRLPLGPTIRVTEPPPYRSALGLSRSRRARTEGTWADDSESTRTNHVT